MNTIFFDLETTDLNPVGQILNYAFVEVDEDWNIKSCLRDKIKISRIQLPSPDAIVATKTDVLLHNLEAKDSEHIALAKIQKHLQGIIEWTDTRLVGYNSNKFDVPYLRTSMIRNGLNPYFGGSVKYGDVLHVVKRLACDRPDFYEKLQKREDGRPIFKLESVAKSFDLLDKNDVQSHESLSDVLLTIKLAKHLAENYGIDVRTYESYEAPKSSFDVIKVFPFVDETRKQVSDEYCYFAVLEQNKTQALLINLKKFEDGLEKQAVSWYNKNTSPLFVQKVFRGDQHKHRAEKARQSLSHINLKNFWPEKNCDIEQFIFMMPIGDIPALYDAVWRKDIFLLKEKRCKLASQLYLRYLSNTADIDQVENQIHQYAIYRYGGKMKLDKDNFDVQYQDGVYSESFHPTYNELMERLDELSKNPENASVMASLKRFYDTSVISTIAGKELSQIVRKKTNV
jgi:DNA polymerase III epsilon subunit-like protein